jgi:hypothetical protein
MSYLNYKFSLEEIKNIIANNNCKNGLRAESMACFGELGSAHCLRRAKKFIDFGRASPFGNRGDPYR